MKQVKGVSGRRKVTQYGRDVREKVQVRFKFRIRVFGFFKKQVRVEIKFEKCCLIKWPSNTS